jgi:Tol biopolymer transport system component
MNEATRKWKKLGSINTYTIMSEITPSTFSEMFPKKLPSLRWEGMKGRGDSRSPRLVHPHPDPPPSKGEGNYWENFKYFWIGFVLILCALLVPPVLRGQSQLLLQQEKHLANLRQLTFEGKNAEAYFSFDGNKLIFQSTRDRFQCDQIFTMNPDGSDVRLVSTGKGQTTCAYFFPNGERVLFSSTHHVRSACPPPAPRGRRFIWPLHPYEIFTAKTDGSELKQLTFTGDYNAEATVSRDGKIVFTSLRDGDLDIYSMNSDGSGVKRLTHQKGYDGGPFSSADGKMIVYRAYYPRDEKERGEYEENLAKRQVVGGRLELFVMNSDGSNQKQITDNGASNFCPFFHPGGKQIIFSSNLHHGEGREFDLFLAHVNGTGMERITFHPGFDAFPMFSPDGKKIVFASNRNAKRPGEFNIFIADWIP